MITTLFKENDCIICHKTFTPIAEPGEGESGYEIYCSAPTCANKIFLRRADPVRVTYREAFGLKGEPLLLVLQEALADCFCGGKFAHNAGKRCPSCIEKIASEKREQYYGRTPSFIWSMQELKKRESGITDFIVGKATSGEQTFAQLVESFEAGEMGAEKYMEELDNLQLRESTQLCAIKTWAMILGRETAFRAAEELELVERYGTRILITIASGLEMSLGIPAINLLSKELENWDGTVQKELQTYIGKVAGR